MTNEFEEAKALLRRTFSLLAEHDISELHPLAIVNLVSDIDDLLTKIALLEEVLRSTNLRVTDNMAGGSDERN